MNPILIDLHTHTTASDGVLTPQQLIQRAHTLGINMLAITDHDTIAAIPVAFAEIHQAGLPLQLITGVEISTVWQQQEIHLLGLNLDINPPAVSELLAQQAMRRQQRAELIAHRLAKAGIADTLADAWQLAASTVTDTVITRAHFAKVLVQRGLVRDIRAAFKRYLSRGNTGYVPPQWCTMAQAISVIRQAGGHSVLAHPGRYGLSAKWLKRLIAQFAQDGGDGMEVAHCQQPPNERKQLTLWAQQFNLLASQGSDFHQPCPWIELGRHLWLPAEAVPVWQQWNFTAQHQEAFA